MSVSQTVFDQMVFNEMVFGQKSWHDDNQSTFFYPNKQINNFSAKNKFDIKTSCSLILIRYVL